jgi:hypothetical protein
MLPYAALHIYWVQPTVLLQPNNKKSPSYLWHVLVKHAAPDIDLQTPIDDISAVKRPAKNQLID